MALCGAQANDLTLSISIRRGYGRNFCAPQCRTGPHSVGQSFSPLPCGYELKWIWNSHFQSLKRNRLLRSIAMTLPGSARAGFPHPKMAFVLQPFVQYPKSALRAARFRLWPQNLRSSYAVVQSYRELTRRKREGSMRSHIGPALSLVAHRR